MGSRIFSSGKFGKIRKIEKERLSAVQKVKLNDFLWKYLGKCEKERLSAVQKIKLDDFFVEVFGKM